MHLLRSDGSIEKTDFSYFDSIAKTLPGDTEPRAIEERFGDSTVVIIEFSTSSDGRGFSLLRYLRSRGLVTGCVFAGGGINPEQVTLAFQTGFDGIAVEDSAWAEYGDSVWRRALEPRVTLSYGNYDTVSVESIWDKRHTV